MGLPINMVVMLVVLLVLAVLILVSRGGSNFTDFGEDKIGIAGDTSECERLCWECCRGIESGCDDYVIPNRNCGCEKDLTGC